MDAIETRDLSGLSPQRGASHPFLTPRDSSVRGVSLCRECAQSATSGPRDRDRDPAPLHLHSPVGLAALAHLKVPHLTSKPSTSPHSLAHTSQSNTTLNSPASQPSTTPHSPAPHLRRRAVTRRLPVRRPAVDCGRLPGSPVGHGQADRQTDRQGQGESATPSAARVAAECRAVARRGRVESAAAASRPMTARRGMLTDRRLTD